MLKIPQLGQYFRASPPSPTEFAKATFFGSRVKSKKICAGTLMTPVREAPLSQIQWCVFFCKGVAGCGLSIYSFIASVQYLLLCPRTRGLGRRYLLSDAYLRPTKQ